MRRRDFIGAMYAVALALPFGGVVAETLARWGEEPGGN
jgi:hypothetical protein